jgi:hypothetical protein
MKANLESTDAEAWSSPTYLVCSIYKFLVVYIARLDFQSIFEVEVV